ncbi:unnamed protein product [Bathycoccus prasinos]
MSQSFALQSSSSSSSTFSVKNAAKINTRRSSSKGQRGNQLRVKAKETSTSGVTSVVNDQTFEQDVLKSDVPVLVDFWAPWCGPCRMIAPLIDQLAEEYAGKLKAVKLNTDESPSIATEYGIRSIPTVMIFKDGKKMDTVIGAVPKSTLTGTIEKYL